MRLGSSTITPLIVENHSAPSLIFHTAGWTPGLHSMVRRASVGIYGVLTNFLIVPSANFKRSDLFTEKIPLLQAIHRRPRSSPAMP